MRKGISMPGMKSLLIKTLGVLLALVIGFPPAAALAAADSYPSKPVRLILGTAAGGSTDVIGRLIGAKLSQRLGKQFVPENVAGAGGTLAAEMVMRAKPDGYTLLVPSLQIVQNPLLYKVEYDAVRDFTPIAKIGETTYMLTVHPGVPATTVKELIALAKKQPGKLICASAGQGTVTHIAIERFKQMTDTDIKVIQFKGGGLNLPDVLGGHSQILLGTLTLTLPQIKAGKLRALGYGGTKRSKHLPDVPTIAEAGVPGYEAVQWWGVLGPAGMPKEIADKLYKEIAVIMNSEDTKKTLENEAAEPDLMGPEEYGNYLKAEQVKWTKVIKEGNLKVE